MNMRPVYVFGNGRYFKSKQSSILKQYDIMAILDNKQAGSWIKLMNGKTIPILKPAEAMYEIPIVIMVYDFYPVWEELKKLSVDFSRIIFPNVFLPFTYEEKIINDQGGKFCILEGDIYYVDNTRKYRVDSTQMLQNLSKQLERERANASFLVKQAPVTPLNREFGFSRGTPVDRYYIESWLDQNRELIRGDVLEIAEDTYTKQFGAEGAVSHILHVNLEKEGVIKGNLETGEGVPQDAVDCIILTQTLPFIYDCKQVIANLYKMLRRGGAALVTTGGITQISRFDMDQWGHFWSFTTASLKRLIEGSAFGRNYAMSVYGNVKTACALLYGVAAEELREEELRYFDEDYPVSICAVLRK